MLSDIYSETDEIVSHLLGYARSVLNADANSVIEFGQRLDKSVCILSKSNMKGKDELLKFLRAAKRFSLSGISSKYVDMVLLLPETYVDSICHDYRGDTLEYQEAVLPDKPVVPESRNYNNFHSYQSERLFLSEVMTFTGKSGKKYRALTAYKPLKWDYLRGLDCSVNGVCASFPSEFRYDKDNKARKTLYAPLTVDARIVWKGKIQKVDGIEMGEITTFSYHGD